MKDQDLIDWTQKIEIELGRDFTHALLFTKSVAPNSLRTTSITPLLRGGFNLYSDEGKAILKEFIAIAQHALEHDGPPASIYFNNGGENGEKISNIEVRLSNVIPTVYQTTGIDDSTDSKDSFHLLRNR